MNKCPNCGYEVGKNSKNCTNCGFDLVETKENKSDTYLMYGKPLMIVNWCLSGISLILVIYSLITGNNLLITYCPVILAMFLTIVFARLQFSKIKYVRVSFIFELIFFVFVFLVFLYFISLRCGNIIQDCD